MEFEKDDYFMDMENQALADWDDTDKITGIGKKRLLNDNWIRHIQKYIDTCNGLENAMIEYKKWVFYGGGDDWFLNNDYEDDKADS